MSQSRMNYKTIIPNGFTCLNLACGVVGLVCAFNEQLVWSSCLIGVAMLFDFIDGLAARLLKATSELGKQLDSLADLVSFGVLPAVILFQFITIGYGEYYTELAERDHFVYALAGVLVAVFSALRLAKFNIDTKQADTFRGLPTPANALFIASIPVIMELQFRLNFYMLPDPGAMEALKQIYHWDGFDQWMVKTLFNPGFHIGLAVVSSALLVSPIPLFSLKFKNIRWSENKIRYIFIIVCLLTVAVALLPNAVYVKNFPYLEYTAIPIVVILYILFSVANNLITRKK